MLPSIKELRDLGLTDRQALDVVALFQKAEAEEQARADECIREYERERKRNYRMRVPDMSRTHVPDVRDKRHLKEELPSRDLSEGKSILPRKKRALPDDWNPVVAEADAVELQRFKDHAKANARRCADWDAAWRNWLSSPYRKPNGGHSNGNGRSGSVLAVIEKIERHIEAAEPRELDFGPGAPGVRLVSKG